MFQEFELEKFMSENEQNVEHVFGESGVEPMHLGELLENDCQDLMKLSMNYPEVNGLKDLRKVIGNLYGEKDTDKILVSVGASEANYILAQCLVNKDDEIAILQPTYRQFAGCAENRGGIIKNFYLVEENGWALDFESLEKAVTSKTKVIAIVNPNNPTGNILQPNEYDAIVNAAKRCGAWLIADEVYIGSERTSVEETPSFYTKYDKCIALGSLSKAYGLPGLRVGWAIGPKDIITQAWRHHEYATISASMIGNHLALHALSEKNRPRIIQRTRGLIKNGWKIMEEMMEQHKEVLSVIPPQASAMCFIKYDLPIKSVDFAMKLIQEKSILVVPGIYFGQEFHIRFSFALPEPILKEGLKRISELILSIKTQAN